ncbi:MAG: VWA domain-containing protein [Ktedonobacterales bacterium]|nr:VWA domain-containing protein [Ktedonobacterales bacterium]
MSLPAVNITTQLAREPLPVTGEAQMAYLLVEVRAGAILADVPRPPLNLALVLDRSGSMRGPRLQYMKAATAAVIDLLTPDDVLSIITYDDMIDLVADAQPVGDPAVLKAAVEMIEEGGGTAMALGMSLGLAELRRHLGPHSLSRMIVLTDGPTNGDEEQCRLLATGAGSEGIAIAPLGFGAEWDETLLEDIATASGGDPPEYIRAPGDVIGCFTNQVQTARGVVIPGLTLDMRFVAGVTPRRVTRVAPFLRAMDASITDRQIAMHLGDLALDIPQALLVEIVIEPKRGGNFRIAQIETSSSAGTEAAMLRSDVVVTFSASATKRPQMRPVVLHYVERVNAARIVWRALAATTHEPVAIAPNILALYDFEGREQLERLRAGRPLTPEGRKILQTKTHALTKVRRIHPTTTGTTGDEPAKGGGQ